MRLSTVGFILTFALAILSAPSTPDAQQPAKVPRVGFLCPRAKPGPPLVALQQALRELGYVEGQNIVIETRFAAERPERLHDLAAELVRLKVDVIVPMDPPALRAAKQASSTIPIVMTNTADPVGTGLVASLARPGGNITGLTLLSRELAGKRLELLKEVIPGISWVGVFWNPVEPDDAVEWRETQLAARALGLQLQSLEVRGPDDVEKALSAITKGRADALILLGLGHLSPDRKRIIEFAATNRLPAMGALRHFVVAGGFMAYGPNYEELYGRAAVYVDKILKGAKPADLPVEQPTRFELVINLKTAKALGLTIPQSVLFRADHVIHP